MTDQPSRRQRLTGLLQTIHPRGSTMALTAVFLTALVTYSFVRPPTTPQRPAVGVVVRDPVTPSPRPSPVPTAAVTPRATPPVTPAPEPPAPVPPASRRPDVPTPTPSVVPSAPTASRPPQASPSGR